MPPAVEISFISYKHYHDVGVSVLAHLLEPAREVVEGLFAGDVVHKECARSSAVVAASDAFEGLLTGGVPNLKFYIFLVDLDRPRAELYADGQVVLLTEALVSELKQQT